MTDNFNAPTTQPTNDQSSSGDAAGTLQSKDSGSYWTKEWIQAEMSAKATTLPALSAAAGAATGLVAGGLIGGVLGGAFGGAAALLGKGIDVDPVLPPGFKIVKDTDVQADLKAHPLNIIIRAEDHGMLKQMKDEHKSKIVVDKDFGTPTLLEDVKRTLKSSALDVTPHPLQIDPKLLKTAWDHKAEIAEDALLIISPISYLIYSAYNHK